MNSNKKIIVVLLFMMTCGVSSARADDTPCDDIHIKNMRGDKRICRACRDLHDKLSDREQAQVQLLDTNTRCETDCRCELLEEIENGETCRPEKQDQQADILEKLLLEPTAPGVSPTSP